jgi:mannose-6-phosphate isomerase-like protein (cupin superfamily)
MKIPNADFLERTNSENLSARRWRYPAKSAGTRHKHIRQEEFYFVLEGTGGAGVAGHPSRGVRLRRAHPRSSLARLRH